MPTIWKLLAEAPEFEHADLSSLRCLYSGGAPLPTWIAERYQQRGLVFKQGFGMTEVGVNCFAMTIADSVRKLGSIGKAMMHTQVRLVGADGNDVAPGEVGELWFRGPHVSLGYWRNPEATAAAYGTDGWFRSGDLARCDDEGFFTIAGRAKEMIISGGVNVYPAEIEAVLLQHPGVRDAAVVGVEDATWGEVGVAFVVPLAPGSAERAPARVRRRPPGTVQAAEGDRSPPGIAAHRLRQGDQGRAQGALPFSSGSEDPRIARTSRMTASDVPRIAEGAGAPVVLLNGGMMSFPVLGGGRGASAARYRLPALRLSRPAARSPATAGTRPSDRARRRRRGAARPAGWPAAHLIGASFGAEVALELAASRPERVPAPWSVITAMDRVDAAVPARSDEMRAVLARRLGGDRALFYDLLVEAVYSAGYRRAEAATLAARRAPERNCRWHGSKASTACSRRSRAST